MTTDIQIPFNRPHLAGRELIYIPDAVASGRIAGDGKYTKLCHALIEEAVSVPKVLLTTSCTHALEMAALLLNLGPGDEVIVPSFTFVSTVSAFVLRGAKPVFADVRPDTLNLDESRIDSLVTERTRAIIPVHYAGVACAMNEIMGIALKHNLAVVEDNAHGLFGRYRGQFLGTFGCLATQSFHETKNFHCGEGGALLINDRSLIERAEIIREKGTNRSRYFRGMVDKYTWVDLGSSYLPSDVLAAFLLAQLQSREEIQRRRREIWERYSSGLGEWAKVNGVRLPVIPHECDQSYHMFYMLLPSLEQRQALIAHLRSHGILAVFHYLPLHLSSMGSKFGGYPGECPVTERVSDQLLRLPFFNDLSATDQLRVIEAVLKFKC